MVLFGLYSDGSQVASIGTPFEFHPVVAFLLLDDVSRGRRQLSYKRVGYVQKVADKTLHPKLLELDKYALVAGLARLSCAACMFIPPSWHAGQLQSVAAWSYPLSTAWVFSLDEIKRLALSKSFQCVLASAKELTER